MNQFQDLTTLDTIVIAIFGTCIVALIVLTSVLAYHRIFRKRK